MDAINWQFPVNWDHPLNKGLVHWWIVTPQDRGGTRLRDLCDGRDMLAINSDETLFTAAELWGLGRPPRPNTWGHVSGPTYGTNKGMRAQNIKDPAGEQTIMSWFAINDHTQNNPLISWGRDQTADVRASLVADNVPFEIGYWDNVNSWLRTGVTLVDGEWTHGCATYSTVGDTNSVYHNGVQKATRGSLGARLAGDVAAFMLVEDLSFNAESDLDLQEARLYNRALSQDEINEYYELSRVGYPGLFNRRFMLPIHKGKQQIDHQVFELDPIGMKRHVIRWTSSDDAIVVFPLKLSGAIVRAVVVPGQSNLDGYDITLQNRLDFDVLEGALLDNETVEVRQEFVWDGIFAGRFNFDAERLILNVFNTTAGDNGIIVFETLSDPDLPRSS